MLTFLVHSFIIGVGTFLKSKNPKIKVVLADPQVGCTILTRDTIIICWVFIASLPGPHTFSFCHLV